MVHLRINLNRLVVAPYCILVLSGRVQGKTQVIATESVSGVDLQGCPIAYNGLFGSSDVVESHSEVAVG